MLSYTHIYITIIKLQAASELIKASVEPTLEEYRPAILKSMKFSKLTLGTVAPHFSGKFLIKRYIQTNFL